MSSSSDALSQIPSSPPLPPELAADDARDAHRRPQRAARHLHVAGGLLDARRRHLQVGVEGQRFGDERGQCGSR